MYRFEVLCVTMNQCDFSKYKKMKLESDAVFANQCGQDKVEQIEIDGHNVKMYSTNTKGVGLNRNIALMNATADICLLADDDMTYCDGYEKKIVDEFRKNPKADVIIFNIGTTTPEYGRMPTQIHKFKRLHSWSRNPYGAPRIAFKLAEVQKRGIFFSQYFGGGTKFPSGEDTIWLSMMMKLGLKVYLSPVMIGNVSYETSSWFSADVKEICYGRGALLKARKSICAPLWTIYYSTVRKPKELSVLDTLKWIEHGKKGFLVNRSYKEFIGESKHE